MADMATATREKEPLIPESFAAVHDFTGEYTSNSNSDKDDTTTATLISRTENEAASSLWQDTDLRQKMLLVDLMLMDFLTLFSTSIPSPFFSRIVIKRGGTILYSAIILQSLMLSFSIFCVLFGKYLSTMGVKRLFVGGLATFGICQVAFGFLHYVSDINAFTGLGVLIRITQGAGEAAFAISSLSVICEEYPGHITKVFGFTEAMVGVGYLMGPLFGGGLFDKMGMLLPLAVSGSIVIIAIPCHFFLLQQYAQEENVENSEFNVLKWLSNPYVISLLCSVATVFGTFGYLDVAITTYLETLGFTTTRVGLVLFAVGLSYCVDAVLIGYLVQLTWVRKVAMTVGFVGFSLILMVYTQHQLTPVIYLGSSALGQFAAIATVPAFEELLPSDIELSLDVHSAVSGAWYGCIGLGMFVLPLIGSTIHKALHSFSWGLFVLSAVGFAVSLLLVALLFAVKRLKRS